MCGRYSIQKPVQLNNNKNITTVIRPNISTTLASFKTLLLLLFLKAPVAPVSLVFLIFVIYENGNQRLLKRKSPLESHWFEPQINKKAQHRQQNQY